MSDSKPFPGDIPIPGIPQPVALARAPRGISTENGNAVTPVNLDADAGTYDFSAEADRILNVFFSRDNGASYQKTQVADIVGATPNATTAAEVQALLDANELLNKYFTITDEAGTLRLVAKFPSSRFKVYFTGTAAAVLGGVMATAIAPGSAAAAGDQAGAEVEFAVEDQEGNALALTSVRVSALVSGTPSTTAKLGLPSKGEQIGDVGGYDAIEFITDKEGRLKFRVLDTGAETINVTAFCGPALTNTIAAALKAAQDVVVS